MRVTMVQQTRFRIGLLAVLLVGLIVTGYFIVRPLFLNERTIRIALTESMREWTGGTLTVSGPVRLSYFPRLQLELNNVRMAEIKSIASVDEIQAERVDVRLGLGSLISSDPVVDRVTFVDPVVQARTAGAAKDPDEASGASAAFATLLRAPFEQIAIENGQITVSGPQTKEEFNGVALRLNISQPGGALSSRGTFTWRGQEVSFRHNSGAGEKTGKAVRMPIELSIEGSLLAAEVEGTATLDTGLKIDGDTDLQVPDLSGFAKWTGVLLPDDMEGGAFAANGTFHWAGYRIGFDQGTFALDGNRAIGAVALEIGGPRPQIEGTLALQRLDLTRYIRSRPTEESPNDAAGNRQREQSVQMDFPLLHHVNVDLRISTTELTAGQLSVGQSALSVVLNAGRLAADIAVFDICGGNGDGRLEFDATVPDSAFRATTTLTNVLAESCIGLFTSQSPLKGRADVTAELTSNGRVAEDLIAGLNGKAIIDIPEGQIAFDALRLLTDLKAGPIKGWQDVSSDDVEFRELSGELLFRRGEIYTDSLQLGLVPNTLRVEGAVGLTRRNLDLRLQIAKAQESEAPGETKPEPELVGAIVIKGPWSEPTFRLEPPKSSAGSTPAPEASQAAWLGAYQ